MVQLGFSQTANVKKGGAGRWFLALFMSVFLVLGLSFLYFVVQQWLVDLDTYSWRPEKCQVVTSRVDTDQESDAPFTFVIEYTYDVAGETYRSDRLTREESTFDDYAEVQRLLDQYPLDSQVTCFVDPDDPSIAVLRRGGLWFGLVALFPLVFVAVGGVGVWWALFGSRRSSNGASFAGPLSSRAKRREISPVLLGAFFSIFLFAGCGFGYMIVVKPIVRILAARDWESVSCKVVWSHVRSHDSDDSTTYSVDILFTYDYKGREYKSNRYNFKSGSSSGYAGKHDIVEQHPPGTTTVCFVNPDDPTEAVIDRGWFGDLWFGFIPLVFMVVGAGGVFFCAQYALRHRNAPATAHGLAAVVTDQALLDVLPEYERLSGPVILKPTASPFGKLVAATLFTLFWNGIVSVFVYQAYEGFVRGRPEWFLTIFLIPFVLIGLIGVVSVVLCFLALFNPRPVITVDANVFALGDTLNVNWNVVGRASRIRRLTIRLIGQEQATYARGTSTYTDKETFIELPIADAIDSVSIVSGAKACRIPAATMHSLDLDHNKIEWKLIVDGEIARWPDVSSEYAMTVLPSRNVDGTEP